MWFLLALSSAFLTATSAVISKVILRRNDEYLVGWLRLVISTPFLLLILFWVDIPRLDATFFHALIILIPLEITAYFLHIKAIKRSPLSLTLPFLALTPVFLILTGWIILKERVSPIGICGVSIVFVGAYLLNIETFHLGILEPIKSIFREKGSLYMVIVAFIFSITSATGKLAIEHSSPLFFGSVYFPIITLFLIPLVYARYRQGVLDFSMHIRDRWLLLLLGFVFCLCIITHCFAITMTKAAYMVAVKRLSMVFGVAYGWLIFKERNIANRFLGTCLMIIGVILIAFAK